MQNGDDELLACDGEEEYAAKGGEGFVEEFEVVYPLGPGVLNFVAEGRAEEKVGEVEVGEVCRVCDSPKWRGEFDGEVFAEGGEFAGVGAGGFGGVPHVGFDAATAGIATDGSARFAFGLIEFLEASTRF